MDKESFAHWPAQTSILSKCFELFSKMVLRYWSPLSVHGLENIPSKYPFIMCSNHSSHIDSAVIMVAAKLPFAKTGLIAAKDYFFDKSHSFILHYLFNLVPIARGTGSRAIKETVLACQSFLGAGGIALVIYPEGTRSVDGNIAAFKQGPAILAHDLALPILPVYIEGSHKALSKGSYIIKPYPVAVHFAKPLRVNDFLVGEESDSRKELFNAYRLATEELERRVRALKDESKTNAQK